jgi:DnaK suppressor protein
LPGLRDAAARRVLDLRADLDSILDSASSTTGDDEHDPEGATIGFERAQAQALLDQAIHRLGELDAVIARDGAGYGVCERCGRPIPAERLAARPEATRCVPCASLRR